MHFIPEQESGCSGIRRHVPNTFSPEISNLPVCSTGFSACSDPVSTDQLVRVRTALAGDWPSLLFYHSYTDSV